MAPDNEPELDPYEDDEERLAKANELQINEREDHLLDLKSITDTEHGRRFLWRLLAECRIYQSSFTGNSTTYFNEGIRHIGLFLLGEINDADPKAIVQMMHESVAAEMKKGVKKTVRKS